MLQSQLHALSAQRIIAAVADAAERWADADFPPRVRATAQIVQRTGYAEPVVEFALDRLFFPLTREALAATIESELGSLDALDGFVAAAGRPDRYARGVERVCIISSRTTIGVALWPAIFALCAKCDVTVKDREDAFIAAFFETLREEHDAFAAAATATQWDGKADPAFLEQFNCVAAFGKDATLREIRAACATDARFIPFGNRASAGYITAKNIADPAHLEQIASGVARDLVLYDTEGCMSLHVLFVEAKTSDEATALLEALAAAAREATIEFPLGKRDDAATARVAHRRNAATFRAASGRGMVFSDDACTFVLTYDVPPDEEPAFAPRALGVLPVETPADVVAYLRRHGIALEAFALSDERPDVIAAALSAGAVRLAPFGELQRPPVSGDHGGRPRIADFIRWIDKEI